MNWAERVAMKLTSGRFLLTVVAGWVFSYLAVTGTLSPGEVMAVVGSVFGMYFAQERGKGTEK